MHQYLIYKSTPTCFGYHPNHPQKVTTSEEIYSVVM